MRLSLPGGRGILASKEIAVLPIKATYFLIARSMLETAMIKRAVELQEGLVGVAIGAGMDRTSRVTYNIPVVGRFLMLTKLHVIVKRSSKLGRYMKRCCCSRG